MLTIVLFVSTLLLVTPRQLQAQTQHLPYPEININLLQDQPSAQIPFRSINNLILIPVKLGNLVPLEFLLDTGVRTPILTDRYYSDFLNITYDRTLSLKGAGQGGDVHAYMASDVKMLLPNVQMKNQPMLVLEEDYLDLGSQLGVPVQGIIGYELFARFVVKIDYVQNMLTLYEPNQFKAPGSYSKLDLRIENSKPFVYAQVVDHTGKKHKLKLLVDTGASHALLLHGNPEAHDEEKVALPEKTIIGSLGRGLLGDINGHIGRLPSLNLGRYSFSDVLASFPEESSYSLSPQEKDRDGTLGGEILSRFTVIIDYPHNAIYFQRAGNHKRPFIFNKTGLTLAAKGIRLETKTIIDVRKDSPAEAVDIRKGDIIYKINGQSADRLMINDIGELLRRRDGKRVRFVLIRDGIKIKKKFRLKDII